MPMPEIEHAIECMPAVRDLQKRVRELEAFARWVAIVASNGNGAEDFELIAEQARGMSIKGD